MLAQRWWRTLAGGSYWRNTGSGGRHAGRMLQMPEEWRAMRIFPFFFILLWNVWRLSGEQKETKRGKNWKWSKGPRRKVETLCCVELTVCIGNYCTPYVAQCTIYIVPWTLLCIKVYNTAASPVPAASPATKTGKKCSLRGSYTVVHYSREYYSIKVFSQRERPGPGLGLILR